MPRTGNIETLLEDAIVSLLETGIQTSGVTVTRWDDIKDKDLNPMVKVKASVIDQEPGTFNLFCGTRLLVDIGIFSSRREDEDARTNNIIRGEVRAVLGQVDIVEQLNITTGLAVYNNGVILGTSSDVEDDRNWHRNLTVTVVATTS